MYLHAFGTYIIREKANEYIDSSMWKRWKAKHSMHLSVPNYCDIKAYGVIE